MPLCQLEFVCACKWDYVVIFNNKELSLRGTKTFGLRWCLFRWAFLTRRLQTAAIFFQRRIFCGLSGCCTSFFARSLATASVLHTSRLRPVCKLCHSVRSERGKLLALTNIWSFQHRPPKPQIPSQSVFSARMHRLAPHKGGHTGS